VLTVAHAPEGQAEDEGPGTGYTLNPSTFAPTARRAEGASKQEPQNPSAMPTPKKKKKKRSSKASASASAAPRNWRPPDFAYPARGTAEAVGVIGTLSVVLWIFTILLPEYCASLQRDAEALGARSMGHLVSLITVMPAVLLTPLALLYTLQYLARVLIARAMGDSIPPRSPDRNFDGFLSGLDPWLVWLFLSGAIVLLVLAVYEVVSGPGYLSPTMVLGVGLVALPYWLMALMLSFLHDDPWAAKPWTVIATILKLNISYGILCVTVAAVIALSIAPFAALLSLREKFFWVYVPATLIAWAIVLWGAIVAMGTVGGFYHKHREQLRWHQERPRWGVTWKL